jgi:hypothetical protein
MCLKLPLCLTENIFIASQLLPVVDLVIDQLINFKIESLEDPNHRIRDLVQKRIVDFNKQIISGNMKNGMQVLIYLFPNTYFKPLFCTHIFLVS